MSQDSTLRHCSTRALWMMIVLGLSVFSVIAEEPASDPVLDGVLQMLEADLSTAVVLQWLEGADAPRRPSATEMVELRKAGASDRLLTRILERAAGAEPIANVEPKVPAETDFRVDAVNPVASPEPEKRPAPVAEPARKAPRADGPVDVSFTLSYSPYVPEDEDEWQLYAYLDGKPLTYVPTRGFLSGKPLEFNQPLEPGRHTLRLTQELHEKTKKSVKHRARAADFTIPITIESTEPVEVEVKFHQTLFRGKNPFSYRVAQGDRVSLQEDIGGNPDRWPEICEDIELGLDAGKKAGRSMTQRLESCLRWSSLWADGEAMPRNEVLDALSQFDYRPVPRPQTLH